MAAQYELLSQLLKSGGRLDMGQELFYKFYQAFVLKDRWLQYIGGVGTTLLVTAIALAMGVLLGSVVALVRVAHDQQRPGRRNKRQAGGQRTQPQLRAGIMQGKAGQRVRQRQLRQHGGGAQYGRCCRKAAQRRGHAAPTGQALRTQPCGRHIDARRSQRNKHHIDG